MKARTFAGVFMLLALELCGCEKVLFSEQTHYAPNFSERAFQSVTPGIAEAGLTNSLGQPLVRVIGEATDTWLYEPTPATGSGAGENLFSAFTRLTFDSNGKVKGVGGDFLKGGIFGLAKPQVLERYGEPTRKESKPPQVIYRYTLPGRSETYERRDVYVGTNGTVISKIAELYTD
jgi:hypothetical protein